MSHDKEVWAELSDYDEYLVSSYGQVYHMPSKNIINERFHERGFLKVRLYNNWGMKEFYVHHLVGLCFFDDYRPGMHIRHNDGDKTNNHVDNLVPARRRRSSYEPGSKRGSRVRIIETGDTFLNAYACARYVEGDVSSIYKCLRGQRNHHRGFTYEYI